MEIFLEFFIWRRNTGLFEKATVQKKSTIGKLCLFLKSCLFLQRNAALFDGVYKCMKGHWISAFQMTVGKLIPKKLF